MSLPIYAVMFDPKGLLHKTSKTIGPQVLVTFVARQANLCLRAFRHDKF